MNRRDLLKTLAALPMVGTVAASESEWPHIVGVKETPWPRKKVDDPMEESLMPYSPKTFRLTPPAQRTDIGSRSRPGGEWLHSTRWRKCRKLFLNQHPLCIDCEAKGVLTTATDVDHEPEHNGVYEKFWDETTWKPRCHSCHSKRTARESGGFGNRRKH